MVLFLLVVLYYVCVILISVFVVFDFGIVLNCFGFIFLSIVGFIYCLIMNFFVIFDNMGVKEIKLVVNVCLCYILVFVLV